MRTKITRKNLLLLDADVVIDLFSLGLWEHIVKHYNVHLSHTVFNDETIFYDGPEGNRVYIKINPADVTLIETSAVEMTLVNEKLKPYTIVLDAGELESIACLLKKEEMILCTCDHSAIMSLVLLDRNDSGISVEDMIHGCHGKINIQYKHSRKRFEKYLNEGAVKKIQTFKAR